MPTMDKYAGYTSGLTGPLTRAVEIAPSDAEGLPFVTRVFMLGQAGDVRVLMQDSDAPVTLPALQPGVMYALRVAQVLATGTTASGLVGLD